MRKNYSTFSINNKYVLLLVMMLVLSFTASAQYTPSYVNSNTLDWDSDSIQDYVDIDDDQDGLTDVLEGCSDFDIEGTIGPNGSTLTSGSTYALVGTNVTYTHNLTDFEVVESELLSPTQGYGIKVREDNASASGTLTVDFSTPVDNLFFKLVDFDQDEYWTVTVYDETNTSIPLTTGNDLNGLYMMGEQVELLSGQQFHDASASTGPNPTDDAKFDKLNAAYFYFPTKKVSQIVFDITHPTNGAMRFIGMQYCPTDTDGDGITNDRDSDSDNDAIPDAVEAGGTDDDGDGMISGVDTDKDGLVDAFDAYESSMTQTGDCSGTNATPHVISFTTSKVVTSDVGISFYITGDYDLNSGSPSNQETLDYQIDDGAGGWTNIETKLKLGAECTEVFYMKDSPLPISAADWNTASADGIVQFRFIPSSKVDTDSGANVCPPSCLGDVTVYFNEAGANGSSIPDYDSDGDGIQNRIDLDSDKDGIVDLVEVGQPDVDGNGMIDGFTDSNNDGYHDAFDGAGSQLITGADSNADGLPDSYPNKNPDNNGFPNFMDLDSDDDGITDNTEAQATGAYVTYGTTDSDSDGLADAFDAFGSFGGAGLTPVDTDTDGTPDYLDLDSDGTEEADNIEGHDTNGDGVIDGSDSPNANTGLFTGIDADNDGLDDGFDNNTASFDATNNGLKAISHPIFDAGADRDWRYSSLASGPVTLDFDGTDDHIDYGDEASFEFASSFSLEAWVLQEATVTTGTIVSKSNAKSGNEKGYKLVVNNSYPNLKWYDNSSTLIVDITSPYAISNDRWYHIAATYDGSTAKLYIDGIEVASTSTVVSPSYDTEDFMIGATYDSDTPSTPRDFFNGYIDEVRIWNTALNVDQLHEMMNQEIEQNGTAVRGKVIPLDISGGLLWTNLEGYYDMNDDDADDKSGHARDGAPQNITTLQEQTAPLPYTSKANGNWDDTSSATPWTYGDTVWDAPNSIGVDGSTSIDWNIVVTDHDISIDTYDTTGRDRNVLGLIVNSNEITVSGDHSADTGNGLTITNYLKLDGKIDLEGESQLIQTDGSILAASSAGTIEKDQQGTRDLYTYNYWSAPVGTSNTSTNNNSYTLPTIFKDGTSPSAPASINFLTSGYNGSAGSPISIADYWIWKYANQIGDTYSAWQHVRSTGTLNIGEGFTMKGVANTSGNITLEQNYVFDGKPNNGEILLSLTAGNNFLVGNPYASAIDANEFILDNIGTADGGRNASGNVINGVIYLWDHFASGTHVLADYEGGYATITLMGGTPAICNDVRINATLGVGTKIPERYIPVGQGFFVSAMTDATGGLTQPIVGGNIVFKNSQRVYKPEEITGTNSGSVFLKSASSSTNQNIVPTSDTRPKIRLELDSPIGYHRQLLAGVDTNASNGFDLGYDAPLNETNLDDMYWVFNSSKYIIQAVDNFNVSQILPLGVKTSADGISTIRIEQLENIDSSTNIYLHDIDLNIYHDLKQSDYQVYLDAGVYDNRFEVTFDSNNAQLGIDDNNSEDIQIHYSNGQQSIIIINPKGLEIKSAEMYTILGQSIFKLDTMENETTSMIKTQPLATGTYILEIKTKDGYRTSKKVLVK